MCMVASKRYHSNVRFCGQDCSVRTTCIPGHLRKTITKRTKVQCPLIYLSTTSMGITGIEDKQKRRRHGTIFPLVGSGMFLQYRTAGPILTLLSHPLQHACQVTVLLFFVPPLNPDNTRAKLFKIKITYPILPFKNRWRYLFVRWLPNGKISQWLWITY
jgi:hypothetical protein